MPDKAQPSGSSLVTVEFQDTTGAPLESVYILEHSDGRLEEGQLDQGRLRAPAAGQIKLHFPALLDLRFAVNTLEIPTGGAPPEVEVILGHFGLRAGTEATLSFHRVPDDEESGDEEPVAIGELRIKLTTNDAKLLEPQETRARFTLAGLPSLGPGESCIVFCQAYTPGSQLDSGDLEISGPEPQDNEE